MTLFDVIRYPLSTPPTPEEIKALPTPIRVVIAHLTGYHASLFQSDEMKDMLDSCSLHYDLKRYRNVIDRIKKLLYEYENKDDSL